EVVAAEGYDRGVEVLPLLLEPGHMSRQDRSLALGEALQLAEVDRQLWRKRRLPNAFDLFGQQLVHRHAVEGGDLAQAGARGVAGPALVGGGERGLEPPVR